MEEAREGREGFLQKDEVKGDDELAKEKEKKEKRGRSQDAANGALK